MPEPGRSETCAACDLVNRAGARFCTGCGQALELRCAACGAVAFTGERFCAECGAAIARRSPQTEPTSERKQVTVLFADVANSMDLAESVGADRLNALMHRLFAVCRAAVTAFDGTVDKFTGDGVMVLFGAPVAIEDHAARACHAALRLVADAAAYATELRTEGIELAVRVGLNSGEVVAGAVGEAFTAVGHTVGLAQRMENLADPGSIRLSEHTRALLGEEFALHDLGVATVRGSSLPLRSYTLLGVEAGARGRRRGGTARLVGRDEELTGLQAALRAAMDGHGQVVGLVGEAGAGKSRLCDELAMWAAELGVTVRRTAGVSHAQTAPLLPILGFVRQYFGIADADSATTARAKVTAQLLALDPALESELGLLFDFMEIPDPDRPAPMFGPDVRRRRVLELFRRASARRSTHQAVLLILEDLHWFDPHSVAFLEAWLPSFLGTRTLVVANFRPEFHAPWMRHSYYRQWPLGPLDDRTVRNLLADLLGPDASVAPLAEQLLARPGGNPFFAEEIVRVLAADGTLDGSPGAYRMLRPASTLRVPATVHAVLAQRIDRLTPRDKFVLQAASVLGRSFGEAVLCAITELAEAEQGEALRALVGAELIAPHQTDGEFRFWHPLTQEVTYDSLVAGPRRRLHRRAAEAMVALGSDPAPTSHSRTPPTPDGPRSRR